MSAEEELALLRGVAAGDRRAFEAIYRLYYSRLFAYIFRLTRRAEIVEEALNDSMLALWTSAPRFAGRSRVSTWIFGIAHHTALKAIARRKTQMGDMAPEDVASAQVVDPEEPERILNRRQLADTVGRALHALSPEQRAVVELTYYNGFSYREIAAIVGCPENTVKTRMFHARRRLREILPGLGISGSTG